MNATDQSLLGAVLESWDRHNAVLVNLLRALPEGGLDARATPGSPTVAEMFTHLHHERLVSVAENAPEVPVRVPKGEWVRECDPERVAGMLAESAQAVRAAVAGRVAAGRGLDLEFHHPVALLQFLIFHEGYHHGQIKLALKAAGQALDDQTAGPLTWEAWRRRA